MLSVGVGNSKVVCSDVEILRIQPPDIATCDQYMANYINTAGGYLVNPNDTSNCGYCTVAYTNVFVSQVSSSYSTRWLDFGLLWVYILFNIAGAVFIYWIARVPKKTKSVR